MGISPDQIERFKSALSSLAQADGLLGVAVSGGPDSLALLLLAAEAAPGRIEAATVDHTLRPGSREEAETVANLCRGLGVQHETLTVQWQAKPTTAIQERARSERYRSLHTWAKSREICALLTGHHLDDQAETFFMRAARGSGVKGLAAMRERAKVPGGDLPLLRPLLTWKRSELQQICADAGVEPLLDPSNQDSQFERVRVRNTLADAGWLDPRAIAQSAANLAEADAALEWATNQLWDRTARFSEGEIVIDVCAFPQELARRIIARAVLSLGSEGIASPLRRQEVDRLLATLASGGQCTLRGVLCEGGAHWRFVPAPHRTRREQKQR